MHFIFGGRGMGQLEYAKSLRPGATVRDLSACGGAGLDAAGILFNVHRFVRDMLRDGGDPSLFFKETMDRLEDKLLVGDEVGSGVVPVEPFEREWRDEVGRVYQLLAEHAGRVTRVWAGIPQFLKGQEACDEETCLF